MKILIAGAGIAGLTCANAFKQLPKSLPLSYNIIEKNKELRAEGAGIGIPANANLALKHLGLFEKLNQDAHQVDEIIFTKQDGAVLSTGKLANIHPQNMPFTATSRDKLHKLLSANIDINAIKFNTTIKRIIPAGKGNIVEFSDNTKQEYDLIIGADGIRSQVRKLVFGEASPTYLGIKCWRFITTKPAKLLHPTYMLDRDQAFMLYPIGEDKIYTYAHIGDPHDEVKLIGAEKTKYLQEYFSHFGGFVPEVLAELPDHQRLLFSKLESSKEILFSNRHNILLIGDASHACSPMLQQGGAQAIEDALILTNIIAKHYNHPKKIVETFQQEREPVLKWVTEQSDSRIKNIGQMTDEQVAMRDNLIRTNGPVNVQGWKYLFNQMPASAYLAPISSFPLKKPLEMVAGRL